MIVLDASVLIAHVDHTDAHHRRAEELLTETGSRRLVTTSVTLGEVLVGPTRGGRAARVAAAIEEGLGVEAIPVPADAALELARWRANTGVKMPDCCVLYAAHRNHAAIATFDDRLAAAARKYGIHVW